MSRGKRTRAAALGALALLIGVGQAGAVDWSTVKPERGGKRYTLKIYGKDRSYYRLTPGQSMRFDVRGDHRYRVITRVDLRKQTDRKEAIYSYRIGFGKQSTRLYARASTPDDNATTKKGNPHIGDSRFMELDTPKKAGSMSVRVGKSARYPVFFRIQRERTDEGEDYVAITPARYDELVEVAVRENIVSYFRVRENKAITVQVHGPTTLKVLARAMMDDTMRGRIKFSLTAEEDGKLKQTYAIETSASEVSVLPKYPNLRPTRGDDFYLDVPKGTHSYTFRLPHNGIHDVMLRFFIPEDDLGKGSR